jgi:hypothetical protein
MTKRCCMRGPAATSFVSCTTLTRILELTGEQRNAIDYNCLVHT